MPVRCTRCASTDMNARARLCPLSHGTSSARYYVGFIWMNSRVAGTLPGQTKTTLFFNLGNVGTWVLPSQAARAGCAFSSRRLGLRRLSNQDRVKPSHRTLTLSRQRHRGLRFSGPPERWHQAMRADIPRIACHQHGRHRLSPTMVECLSSSLVHYPSGRHNFHFVPSNGG